MYQNRDSKWGEHVKTIPLSEQQYAPLEGLLQECTHPAFLVLNSDLPRNLSLTPITHHVLPLQTQLSIHQE